MTTENVREHLDRAAAQRAAVPGRPQGGPYPGSVGEVADEVVAWLHDMDRTAAPGLTHTVLLRLISGAPGRTGGRA